MNGKGVAKCSATKNRKGPLNAIKSIKLLKNLSRE
jgi:hypothetical protein